MSLYKCMLIKTNVYGERLSSIEDTALHGALKMSSEELEPRALKPAEPGIKKFSNLRRKGDRSDAENINDNTIAASTRCTTDEPIKLDGYAPASDSGEEKKDQKEYNKTEKVLGVHDKENKISFEYYEDSGQGDEDNPKKEDEQKDNGMKAVGTSIVETMNEEEGEDKDEEDGKDMSLEANILDFEEEDWKEKDKEQFKWLSLGKTTRKYAKPESREAPEHYIDDY